jgi:hypothetical protein
MVTFLPARIGACAVALPMLASVAATAMTRTTFLMFPSGRNELRKVAPKNAIVVLSRIQYARQGDGLKPAL